MPVSSNAFLDNARRIFEVAKADPSAPDEQFAVMIRPDGGLHLMMQTPVSLEAAALDAGAESAFMITRSHGQVRVEGHRRGERCLLEKRNIRADLLYDRPSYVLTSG